jgi:hypothetical protein
MTFCVFISSFYVWSIIGYWKTFVVKLFIQFSIRSEDFNTSTRLRRRWNVRVILCLFTNFDRLDCLEKFNNSQFYKLTSWIGNWDQHISSGAVILLFVNLTISEEKLLPTVDADVTFSVSLELTFECNDILFDCFFFFNFNII